MSDTVSYDENIEVQETNFSSGGGDGGGDNSSVSSRGSSSHHHHHHHTSSYSHHTTSYGHSGGGGHHYGGGGRHYGGSKMLPRDGKACKPVIIVVCLVIIAAGLYTFVSSSIEDLTQWANTPAVSPPPPPPPPKPWSGDFSGRYIRQNDGAWAKDSASTRSTTAVAKVLADLDGRQFFISKSEVRGEEGKDESGRVSSNFTTTYFTVVRELDRGAKLRFNFTSGVRFTQKTTRKGKNVVKFNDNEPDYHWEEVPTTITVETWAEGGKKGIWREVQHSSPEVKIKRIFFDDEMTAIFQSKVEHYANRWDIYVVRYHRRPLY